MIFITVYTIIIMILISEDMHDILHNFKKIFYSKIIYNNSKIFSYKVFENASQKGISTIYKYLNWYGRGFL